MALVTDPDIIARVKALAEAQSPEQIATPPAAASVRVTDPATIARVKTLAESQQRISVPKSAVDTYLALYQAGMPMTPGAKELVEEAEPDWASRYLAG
ncbi:MAG: hypothetical protein KDB60_10900, partial [Propionibacteriaceae bacterium]|nr:hypothetical protein [Propionibacteriaceae bacterium]